jgi:VWFA-related protein
MIGAYSRQLNIRIYWVFIVWGLGLMLNLYSQGNPIASQPIDEQTEDTGKDFKIRVDVEEVRLDTVVLKKGHQVTDLTGEDFEIYQDDQRQKVNSCIYISDNRAEPVKSNASPQNVKTGPVLPAPLLTPDKVRRVTVFIVDDLSMDINDIKYSRRTLERYVKTQMQPDELVAILLTKRGTGSLQLFSSDKRQLFATIDSIRPWAPTGSVRIPQLMAISYCIQAMQDMPGLRKTLIVLTTQTSVPSAMDPGNYRFSLSNNPINQLADRALRAGIVIHIMNITGLSFGGPPSFGTDKTGVAALEDYLDYRETQKSMVKNPLPKKTGGLLIEDTNFFTTKAGIGDVAEELKGYYLLTYTPPPDTFKHDRQGIYHRIKIKVKQPKMEVHTRDGFFGRTKSLDVQVQDGNPLQTAIFSPFKHNDLKVDLTSGYIEDIPTGYLLRSWLQIDAGKLSTLKEKDGTSVFTIDAVFVTSDVNNYTHGSGGARYEFRIKKENIAWVREHGIRFSASLPVTQPGAYYVRVGIKDAGSGKIGSAYQFIDIPDMKKRKLAVSSIFIIDRDEDVSWFDAKMNRESQPKFQPDMRRDQRRNPAIRSYQPGESFEYGTVIYNVINPKSLTFQYILFKDGIEVHKSESEALDISSVKDFRRILIRKRLLLDKTMQPGFYVLLIQVKDNWWSNKTNTALQTLDFEIPAERFTATAAD